MWSSLRVESVSAGLVKTFSQSVTLSFLANILMHIGVKICLLITNSIVALQVLDWYFKDMNCSHRCIRSKNNSEYFLPFLPLLMSLNSCTMRCIPHLILLFLFVKHPEHGLYLSLKITKLYIVMSLFYAIKFINRDINLIKLLVNVILLMYLYSCERYKRFYTSKIEM